ncbi:unnamed protein product [Closterium sp. Naga37s-1]|nr:unnamed protein product [Closterium sp. Naga37s-1]
MTLSQHLDSRFRLARDMHATGDAATAELRQLLTADGLSGRITLTTDIWTSENGLAFMVVTAHWVTSDFGLQQAILDFRPLEGAHTGDKIAKELEEVIVEWGLGGAFFGVTTDNAENNNQLTVAAPSKLERHMTLDLDEERVKSLVRERLPQYQVASAAATETRRRGEVTSVRGAVGHAAARVGAAGRGAARGGGYRSFQAGLMAEMATMEAEEGVQELNKVDQYVLKGRQEDVCPLVY